MWTIYTLGDNTSKEIILVEITTMKIVSRNCFILRLMAESWQLKGGLRLLY
jgi:hypothetical protein